MYSTAPGERFIVGGTVLRYESAGGDWELIAEQILCIGEATTESGPAEDGWHICFITDPHGQWLEGSLQAEGRNDLLHWLSVRLGSSLEVKLANAPPFRSRVMWPGGMLEQPLFEYQISPWRRIFSRSLRRLGFGPLAAVQSVRPEVMRALWRARHRPAASRSA
ncbi:MAG TPA: hypothetical protein VGL55_15490 [Steroidobacteraceae bacterium]|jgi:hypothetical protein